MDPGSKPSARGRHRRRNAGRVHSRPDYSAGPEAPRDAITWEHHIPLATNPFILWDVLRFGAAVLALVEVAALATTTLIDHDPLLIPPEVLLGVSGILALLYLFVAGAVFKNDWHVRYAMDAERVSCCGHVETGIVFRALLWVRVLMLGLPVVLLALLSRQGGVVGDAVVEGGNHIAWRDVRKVTFHSRLRVVTLSGTLFQCVRLYCTPASYETVRREASFRAEFAAAWRREHPRKPFELPTRHRRMLLWALVTGVGTLAAQMWQTEFTAFVALAAGGLVLLSGFARGTWRRIFAGMGSLTVLLHLLSVRELAYTSTTLADGLIKTYGYQRDTALLVVSLAGDALLLGSALCRLLGTTRRQGR